MAYHVLLCDADDTLFDFHAAEKEAITQTLLKSGFQADESTCALYHRVNDALWKALERGETTQAILKTERFRQLLSILQSKKDPEAMAALYVSELGQCPHLMPGALAFAKQVASLMPIYLVTNGISAIQRSRLALSVIKPYITDIVISEEVGAQKPDPKMLEIALSKSGIKKENAVMLGDSITADIAAANRAGIDSIHLTWGKEPGESPATYTARDLDEAYALIARFHQKQKSGEV